METKTGIRPHPQFSNIRWYAEETRRQQFHAAIPCARIAWPQFGIPQIGGVGFQAQQRVVGTLAPITRIVADLRLLLTPKHGDHGAVEIKDQAGAVVWPVDELLQQSIVHPVHLFQKGVGGLVQETAQRLWIGKVRQSGQPKNGSRPRALNVEVVIMI